VAVPNVTAMTGTSRRVRAWFEQIGGIESRFSAHAAFSTVPNLLDRPHVGAVNPEKFIPNCRRMRRLRPVAEPQVNA